MKVITLSKRKFENLERIKLSREVLSTESLVFHYNSQGNEKQSNKGQKNSELGQDNTQVYAEFGDLTEIDENDLAF